MRFKNGLEYAGLEIETIRSDKMLYKQLLLAPIR